MGDSDYKKVQKFMGMIAGGSVMAVFVGNFLDGLFDTSPGFLIGLLFYVIFGSLYWLIKQVGGFKK